MSLEGLRLVLDCAHGAAYQVAPAVFHELGAEVVALANQPNGFNINEGVGATHPEYLQAMVRTHEADLGIALDGDGDRVIMADAEGRLYDGDELLYVIVRDRVLSGGSIEGVVGTLMSNLGLEHALQRLGVKLVRAKVGDRYVAEALRERGWSYGGENSGHLLCREVHTTGDGIVSACRCSPPCAAGTRLWRKPARISCATLRSCATFRCRAATIGRHSRRWWRPAVPPRPILRRRDGFYCARPAPSRCCA